MLLKHICLALTGDICLASTGDICPVPAADICLVSTADICPVSTEDIYPVSAADAAKPLKKVVFCWFFYLPGPRRDLPQSSIHTPRVRRTQQEPFARALGKNIVFFYVFQSLC